MDNATIQSAFKAVRLPMSLRGDKTNARKVNALANGERVVLSTGNGFTVAAERTGDGKTLRIVRESATGFAVICQERF
jgi:hypothetical protein